MKQHLRMFEYGDEKLDYQITFDDLDNEKILSEITGRCAYIDECGNFGFDFSTSGTSRYYLLCAVITQSDNMKALESSIETIRKNNFPSGEMKSSSIGDNDKRRIKIITEILPLDFSVICLIADKQAFYDGSPLKEYKQPFIKYLHNLLYNNLYSAYPKLKIIADEMGTSEFQRGFKEYIANKRNQLNLFGSYDFDFTDSKNSNIVQLADIIAGSIYRAYDVAASPKYIDILKGKILHIESFPKQLHPVSIQSRTANEAINTDIFELATRQAQNYINRYAEDDSIEKRLQTALLKCLLFESYNINPFKFVSSQHLLNVLAKYADTRISRDFFYRRIIAPQRDNGVIIASSAQGYKIPVCIEDIDKYLQQTNSIVAPMLHRIEVCRKLVMQQTDSKLDILDTDTYLKYKKYFD